MRPGCAACLILALSVARAQESPPLTPPAVATAAASTSSAPAKPSEVLSHGRFGSVSIYRPGDTPREFVLFVSGDGGWNLGVLSMARILSETGAVVVGIDIRHYMAELERAPDTCVSPAADLEELSHALQWKLGIKSYIEPTLVGYSSGATLVYAALAESAPGQFKGALSLGFCRDLDLKKSICKGTGVESTPKFDSKGRQTGVNFSPAQSLPGRWVSLQGEQDEVCAAKPAQQFVAAVSGAEAVLLPKVGHGYSVERNWVPEYQAAFDRIIAAK